MSNDKYSGKFAKQYCELCERITWMFDNKCGDHSNFTPGQRKRVDASKYVAGSHDMTQANKPTKHPKLMKEDARPLTYAKHHLDPLHTHCVGCGIKVPKAFAYTGRIWTTLQWRTVTKSTTIYSPVTKKFVTTEEEHRIPVDGYAQGTLCEGCASDFSSVPKSHRDGTVTYEPRVKLTSRPSSSTTVNPGGSLEYSERSPAIAETHPVSRPGSFAHKFGIDSPQGAGKLHYDPVHKKMTQEVEQSAIHSGSRSGGFMKAHDRERYLGRVWRTKR